MTELANHRVNRPVSHRHGRAWQDALHFLLGYNLPPIISCHQPRPDASPRDYFFAYKRTPGARALAVFVELYEPGTAGDECSVTLDLSGGGGTYLPPGTTAGQLRSGSSAIQPQVGNWANRNMHMDVLDVSGLTVGALNWIKLSWTDSVTNPGTHGISRIHAIEVPRRDLAVDSSDAGVDGGWPFTGNGLYAGNGTTDMDGFKRFRDEIARARNGVKRHLQMCTPEYAGTVLVPEAWICGVSVGVWGQMTFNHTAQPGFWMRARRLYETTTPNPYKFVCRYSTQHATAGALLRATATSRTTGTVATATLTLAATGAAFAASGEATLNVPCDGTDQDVRITFDFQTDAGADLFVSQIGIIEEES